MKALGIALVTAAAGTKLDEKLTGTFGNPIAEQATSAAVTSAMSATLGSVLYHTPLNENTVANVLGTSIGTAVGAKFVAWRNQQDQLETAYKTKQGPATSRQSKQQQGKTRPLSAAEKRFMQETQDVINIRLDTPNLNFSDHYYNHDLSGGAQQTAPDAKLNTTHKEIGKHQGIYNSQHLPTYSKAKSAAPMSADDARATRAARWSRNSKTFAPTESNAGLDTFWASVGYVNGTREWIVDGVTNMIEGLGQRILMSPKEQFAAEFAYLDGHTADFKQMIKKGMLASITEGIHNKVNGIQNWLHTDDSYEFGFQAGKTSMTVITNITAAKSIGSAILKDAKGLRFFEKEQSKFANLASLPKNRVALDLDITSKGYKYKGISENGYVTYLRNDGSKITIKPDGEVIPTKKVWNSDRTKKYSERQDYYGNRLPDQSHSTGHFVDPFVGPLKPNNLNK